MSTDESPYTKLSARYYLSSNDSQELSLANIEMSIQAIFTLSKSPQCGRPSGLDSPESVPKGGYKTFKKSEAKVLIVFYF
jgi:hypothetical protein